MGSPAKGGGGGIKIKSLLKTSADTTPTTIPKNFENRTKYTEKSAKSYLSSHLQTQKSIRMMGRKNINLVLAEYTKERVTMGCLLH